MPAAAGTALAGLCLLAVAAIVVYGPALIIFHHLTVQESTRIWNG